MISFTGSPKVGWGIQERSKRKKVVLELGGNAACIVDKSITDLDHVVDRILFGTFFYSGQTCISVQRVIVHESLHDDLCKKLAKGAEKWNGNMGDPMNRSTQIGPLISEKEALRVEEWVNEAVDKFGGKLLSGGKRNGAFYRKCS